MWSYSPGATLLDPDEAEGLIPKHVTTQAQLNEFEQNNIAKAQVFYSRRKQKIEGIISSDFAEKVHKKMFGDTWRWAGKYRRTNKNIGVDWCVIPMELRQFFDDVAFQLEHNTYELDELAARFHHRLVLIHPFPNGNGRHARLMTDILLHALGVEAFTWGREQLSAQSDMRSQYISSLRKADKGQVNDLIKFARS